MASCSHPRAVVTGVLASVCFLTAPAAATAQPDPRADTPGLFTDVAGDFRHFVSLENLKWLSLGGAVTLAVAEWDDALRVATEDPEAAVTRTLEAGGTGATYGNIGLQMPLAIGWWAVAHANGNERAAAAGRDLLRAQISALSWTYVVKYAADRTRPNGDPRSFPSGHSSAVFATAMVLQEHYGWKAGLPAFAAATLTAGSRITVNKHWASDVTFGAVLGMVAARTVTIHLRARSLTASPMLVEGGAGIRFTVIR
jgi:hypothetical protein